MSKRPPMLVLIVVYKGFVALLTAATAIALLLALRNYQELSAWLDDYTLQGKQGLIGWLLERLSTLKPNTLKFSGLVAAVYSAVTLLEAVGLWYEQTWARWLVVGLVSISIPPEIYELIQGVSAVKILAFVINLAVLWYLLREFPKHT
jgi:uncharacterized membrane protein (DUF2068 family)